MSQLLHPKYRLRRWWWALFVLGVILLPIGIAIPFRGVIFDSFVLRNRALIPRAAVLLREDIEFPVQIDENTILKDIRADTEYGTDKFDSIWYEYSLTGVDINDDFIDQKDTEIVSRYCENKETRYLLRKGISINHYFEGGDDGSFMVVVTWPQCNPNFEGINRTIQTENR